MDPLRRQLLECDRTILELTYLLSEALEDHEDFMRQRRDMVAQFESYCMKRSSVSRPVAYSVRNYLKLLDQDIQELSNYLETIRCNIHNCQSLKADFEEDLAKQQVDD